MFKWFRKLIGIDEPVPAPVEKIPEVATTPPVETPAAIPTPPPIPVAEHTPTEWKFPTTTPEDTTVKVEPKQKPPKSSPDAPVKVRTSKNTEAAKKPANQSKPRAKKT